MLRSQSKLLVVVLFAVVVAFTGQARKHLDALTFTFRSSFQEMIYLPRGDTLKVLAFGFDVPLADALFIKGLIYYAESLDAAESKTAAAREYSYALFDVITDLSPRFYRAYQIGTTFLSGTKNLQANINSVKLAEKGIAYWDKLEQEGKSFTVDPRWLFYSLVAVTSDVNIQSRLRDAGDLAGAAAAREKAVTAFRKSAESQGAPAVVIAAATRYQRAFYGKDDIEAVAQATLDVWQQLFAQAEARGDKELATDLQTRIEKQEMLLGSIQQTKGAEEFLTEVGKDFFQRAGRPAEGLGELIKDGVLRAFPRPFPLDREASDDGEGNIEPEIRDDFIALPDGAFKSRQLAELQTDAINDMMYDAVVAYRRVYSDPPLDLDILLRDKFLEQLPALPFAALGQHYRYDNITGLADLSLPYGPVLPPDRQ